MSASGLENRNGTAYPFTRAVLALVAAFLLATSTASAQSSTSNSGGRPAESKTGTAGVSTYARDKIESVNLVNGNFSMNIPLTTVGGRGSAAFTINLAYNSKIWSAEHHVELFPLSWRDQGITPEKIDHYSAVFDDPVARNPDTLYLGGGWSILKGPTTRSQVVYIDPVRCPDPAPGDPILEDEQCYAYALTKMWLILPDGSEVEMRDSLTDGAPYKLPTPTAKLDRDRGAVWHSTDGSNITLVSNASGAWVFLPDGSRYHTANGRTTIYDPDGNYLTIDYDLPSAGAVTYTDQLGRKTILQPLDGGGASVTTTGYNGSPDRTVTVETGGLTATDSSGVAVNLRSDFRDTSAYPRPFTSGDALRSPSQGYQEHTLTTPHYDLFVGSEGGQNVDTFSSVTRVDLLDGRSIRFRYSPYAEVAEVVYPGGGVSRVDYQGFPTQVCEAATPFSDTLDRRAIKRQTLTDGSTPDATWIYGYGSGPVDGVSYPFTLIEALPGVGGAGSQPLSSEKHYFMAVNAEHRTCAATGQSNGTTYERWDNAKEFRTETQTGTQPDAETVVTMRHWEQRTPVVWGNDPGLSYNSYAAQHGPDEEDIPNDPRVMWEETKLADGKKKRVEFGYDQFNNVTSVKEYDFGDTSGSTGALLRQTFRKYVGDVAPPDNTPSYNGYCYTNLNPLDPSCGAPPSDQSIDPTIIIHQRHLLLSEEVKDGADSRQTYSEYEYDNYRGASWTAAPPDVNAGMTGYDGARFSAFDPTRQPRGNVTQARGWVEDATYAVSYMRYDNAGHVISTKDPNGNVSTLSYGDDFGDGSSPGGNVAGHYGETFAFPTTATNALGQTAKTQYDYTLGAATGVKDPNGVIARTEYDSVGRPVRTTTALGLAEQSVTELIYPTPTENTAKVSRQLDSTRWLASKTSMDGFDRPVLSATAEDGQKADAASFTIFSKMIYDALGRVKLITNPYRSQPATTDGWTRTTYDLAGRVAEVASFAGGVSDPPPDAGTSAVWTGSVVTSYASEQTTVRDQANKQRRSTVDGLGRLKTVDEMLEYPSATVYATTSYTYDARGNLAAVHQGEQTRTFTYDGLSRLRSATNPEVCRQEQSQCVPLAVTYEYDLGGNLKKKLDSRGIIVQYGYDGLDRVVSRFYTGEAEPPTPNVTYAYDDPSVMNSKGHLTSVSSSVSSYAYTAYDALGRVRGTAQTTAGTTYSMPDYRYDLAGNLTSEQYPSGRIIKTEYDAAGRVAGVRNEATGLYYVGAAATDTANRIGYTAGGAVTAVRLGNGLWEHASFNSRLQPTQVGLGTTATNSSTLRLDYTYGTTDDNGNVRTQAVTAPGAASPYVQTYSYDSVNRLQSAEETINGASNWRQVYSYDSYGNRSLTTGTTLPAQLDASNNPAVSTSNNRITSAGYSYDSAGNLLCDPNHQCVQGQSSLTPYYSYDAEDKLTAAGGSSTYSYDGEGRRVEKVVGSVATVFVYDAGGRMVAEYGGVQSQTSGASYVTQDTLGSTRVVTGQSQEVRGRYDYLPFGEEAYAGREGYGGEDIRQRFTGKERDSETGLDYFGARYYAGAQGRFTSVDPVKLTPARMLEPQRLNLYAYAINNPLKYLDPDGKDVNLDNDTRGGRRKALLSITANITAAEARNVGVRRNKDTGEYEVYIKDPSKVNLDKASQGYRDLVDRVGNHDLQLNYTLLEKGKSMVVELNGVPTKIAQRDLSGANGGDAGGFVAPQSDGSFTVVVAEGGYMPGVAGLTKSGKETTITMPDYITTAHELFGETYKYTPAGIKEGLQNNIIDDSDKVIEIENRYRDFHGLPHRSGTDHGYIHGPVIEVRP